MMDFELKIKNIGKLEDAKIRIGRFTVFAGPNNTGKSYVSKVLYSLFNAMSVNPVEVHIHNLTKALFLAIETLSIPRSEKINEAIMPLRKQAEGMIDLIKEYPPTDFESLNNLIPTLTEIVSSMRDDVSDIRSMIVDIEDEKSTNPISVGGLFGFDVPSILGGVGLPSMSDKIDSLEGVLDKLKENIENGNAERFFLSGMQHKIRENLINNFQVPKLADLSGEEDKPSLVDAGKFGKFVFSDEEIGFRINHGWFQELQRYSNVIYLESPIYWKLKDALEENINRSKYPYYYRRTQLSGVPEYFYDLMAELKKTYTGEIAFPEVYEKLIGKEVLGGKITISEENGSLSFQENGRSFPMPAVATGVAHIGMLALLIERKVLDEESFIFIDEPEAHLHPAWQVRVAEALFGLAKGGVNVVIATHSAEILKWLEVHVKENPYDEELISLNKFPVGKENDDDQDFDIQIANIKKELTKPFSDLYMEGLL